MKALVYHGPGKRAWEYVPDPVIREPTDAIVGVYADPPTAPLWFRSEH